MAKAEASVSSCSITQYLQPDYWDWSAQEKAVLTGSAADIGRVIVDRLVDDGMVVTSAYFIIHDKDTHTRVDPVTKCEIVEVKPAHLHGVITLDRNVGRPTISNIALAVGVEPQYIEKAQRGRYAVSNMLSYLIHAKDIEKYQYDHAEVATVVGRDYAEIYSESYRSWQRGRAKKSKKVASEDKDELLEQVRFGKLTIEQMNLDDELFRVYSQYVNDFREAERVALERQAILNRRSFEAGDYQTTVIYITGASGSGKSHFVREVVAPALQEMLGWRLYQAAGDNPLDDYDYEEILLLDDLRANSFSATDWLLLLDKNVAGNQSARYRNKLGVCPRVIFVVAHEEPRQFFSHVRSVTDEALDQFIRRFDAFIEVMRAGAGDDRIYCFAPIGSVKPYFYPHYVGGTVRFKLLTYGEKFRLERISELLTDFCVRESLATRNFDCHVSAVLDDDVARELQTSQRCDDVGLSELRAHATRTAIKRHPFAQRELDELAASARASQLQLF